MRLNIHLPFQVCSSLALRRNEARLGDLLQERTIELIYARDRAEAESRAKSQLLANVSHELRTEPVDPLAFTAREPAFKSARILITDDDRSNRLLLQEYLRPLGFDLIQAEDGEQALDSARSEDPDLILMDIGLPGMDGIDVTRVLKSEPRTAGIPVIAVTATVIGSRAEEAVSICDDYLTKPVSKAALIEALAKFLEREEEGDGSSAILGAPIHYKILIVDACLEHIQQLGGMVREGGHLVFVARGSSQAIDIADNVELDLILTSVDESHEVVDRLLSDGEMSDRPVVPILLVVDHVADLDRWERPAEITDLLDRQADARSVLARIAAYAELGRLRRLVAGQQESLNFDSKRCGDRLPKQIQQIQQFVVRDADYRRELAGHVHEGPLQDLTLASIQLKLATDTGATVQSELELAAVAVDRANRSLRSHMADLGPQFLTETGLDTALESIVVQARARWEIPFEYMREGMINALPYVARLLLLQSLWHLVRRIVGWPGLTAGDLFVRQLASVLEIQVDFELDQDSSPDGIEGGWRSVDLHGLRERLGFVGAEVDVEIDGTVLRANYRISCRV